MSTHDAEAFAKHRSLLFTVAYEMLGSVADAEDVVSETYLRWAERSGDEVVEHPRAYLVRIVTRLALNRLRTLARRKEDYVGPWLPEPVLTVPDVVDDVVGTGGQLVALTVTVDVTVAVTVTVGVEPGGTVAVPVPVGPVGVGVGVPLPGFEETEK